jgi:acetyl esterase/lipase
VTFPVRRVQDLLYANREGVRLAADLYVPEGASHPPVILWVHGGGWRFGTRRLAPDLSRYFARVGFVMAAVDYRLSHQATFPAQIEDLRTAIRWVRSLAPGYGFDSGRLALLGSSAGGHLAALAALAPAGAFAEDDTLYAGHSSEVQAVVDGYAPTDFLQIDAHRPPAGTVSDDPETLLLPRGMTRSSAPDSFESLLLGAPIGTCPERVRAANPITYARPGAPPFLILHGTSDTTIPAHQSELLFDALAAGGNDVTLRTIEGLGHGFLNRTHLDDGPARRSTVKHHVPGLGMRVEHTTEPIFAAIEEFFRTRLAPARTANAAAMSAARPNST